MQFVSLLFLVCLCVCVWDLVWVHGSTGGVSRKGRIMELFRNENVSQAFLQISCRPEVKNRPCVFLRKHPVIGHYSRCVQQYTYSYAIVRDLEADQVRFLPSFTIFSLFGPRRPLYL